MEKSLDSKYICQNIFNITPASEGEAAGCVEWPHTWSEVNIWTIQILGSDKKGVSIN